MFGIISHEPPYSYYDENFYNASMSPSTIHSRNTELRKFFFKYLFQKVLSVYEWTIPKNWDMDYMRFCLFGLGYFAVINTPKFGVICQNGALSGQNLYYKPKNVIVTNRLLPTKTYEIGVDCEVIKLQPDYSPVIDMVGYYADLMSVSAETMSLNILNVQSATIFGAENQTQAQAFKKMFDKVASGEPAIVIGKKLLDSEGKPTWFPFTQHIKESYVATDILSDMEKIEAQFDTLIGIPNANLEKRERMITDEVNANNTETKALSELWLESLNDGIEKVVNMFGIELSVKRRFKDDKESEVKK